MFNKSNFSKNLVGKSIFLVITVTIILIIGALSAVYSKVTSNPEVSKQQEELPSSSEQISQASSSLVSNSKLVPKEDSKVSNFKDCNLAIKFPKLVGTKEITAYYQARSNTSPQYIQGVSLVSKDQVLNQKKTEFVNVILSDPTLPEGINIECAKSELGLFDSQPNEFESVDIQELKRQTNWPIFMENQGQITDVKTQQSKSSSNIPFKKFIFKYKSLWYSVSFTSNIKPENSIQSDSLDYQVWSEKSLKQGLFGNQIQLQFNDIITSDFSSEIEALPS